LCLVVVFFLVGTYMFVFSLSGVLEKMVLAGKMQKVEESIENLKTENRELRSRLERYRRGERTPRDILNSGYTYNDGRIVFIHGVKGERDGPAPDSEKAGQYSINIKHMRVAWVIFSALVLLFLFSRRQRRTEPVQ